MSPSLLDVSDHSLSLIDSQGALIHIEDRLLHKNDRAIAKAAALAVFDCSIFVACIQLGSDDNLMGFVEHQKAGRVECDTREVDWYLCRELLTQSPRQKLVPSTQTTTLRHRSASTVWMKL